MKARKDKGVAVVDKALGETLLLWLTEPFRDAASTAAGAGSVTPIQAYGWSAFWGYETTKASGVLPEIDKCEPGSPCLAGGDPEADSCSIGGCSEPPMQCSVGGCVGQYCACCGCEPFACCRRIRPCGGWTGNVSTDAQPPSSVLQLLCSALRGHPSRCELQPPLAELTAAQGVGQGLAEL
ncbi:MAG TPA: hypothetical protein PLS95_15995 [Thermoanaerobaculales bacterium]|nr:hypothetical protein [Thermoanaerobaculales bacterium]